MTRTPRFVFCVAYTGSRGMVANSRGSGHLVGPDGAEWCPLCLAENVTNRPESGHLRRPLIDVIKPRGTSRLGLAA